MKKVVIIIALLHARTSSCHEMAVAADQARTSFVQRHRTAIQTAKIIIDDVLVGAFAYGTFLYVSSITCRSNELHIGPCVARAAPYIAFPTASAMSVRTYFLSPYKKTLIDALLPVRFHTYLPRPSDEQIQQRLSRT